MQEFKINTNPYDAEVGQNIKDQILLITFDPDNRLLADSLEADRGARAGGQGSIFAGINRLTRDINPIRSNGTGSVNS